MDNKDTPDFDKLIQNVMSNPEMLKNALEMAGKLSESGALGSLFSGLGSSADNKEPTFSPSDAQEDSQTAEADRPAASLLPTPTKANKRDMTRHRKLLEALELYVSDEKRSKLELVIRLLDLWELASNIGL